MIFYLSGTGNTRWAANAVAAKTGDRLLFMPDLLRRQNDASGLQAINIKLEKCERVGFCFPVHGWRPPRIVREFIARLHIYTEGHYVYALCTAGDNIGETIDILRKDLLHKGIALNAAFSLIMPESYLGLPLFYLDPPAKEKKKKEKAAAELEQYAKAIVEKRSEEHLVRGRWPRIDSRLLGAFFVRKLITDKPFRVDSRKCVKCGICADVCPTRNIVGSLGHEPQWNHDGSCIACFACYHHCPHNAIDYGWVTKGKGQYFFEKRGG